MDQNQNITKPKSKTPLLIGIVVVVALVVVACILVPKLTNKETTEKEQKEEEKPKFELNYDSMSEQVEEKMEEYFTENFAKYYGGNGKYEYYFKVDKETIEYTSDYSENGDKYYVMEVDGYNASTGLKYGRYFARCQWDYDTGLIKNYGDTTILSMMLGGLEDALYTSKLGGYFVVYKEELKNDKLWNHMLVDQTTGTTLLYETNMLHFYAVNFNYKKDSSAFDSFKSKYIEAFKTLKCNKITLHMSQYATDNEFTEAAFVLTYVDETLHYGNDEKIKALDEAVKSYDFYYETVIEGKK